MEGSDAKAAESPVSNHGMEETTAQVKRDPVTTQSMSNPDSFVIEKKGRLTAILRATSDSSASSRSGDGRCSKEDSLGSKKCRRGGIDGSVLPSSAPGGAAVAATVGKKELFGDADSASRLRTASADRSRDANLCSQDHAGDSSPSHLMHSRMPGRDDLGTQDSADFRTGTWTGSEEGRFDHALVNNPHSWQDISFKVRTRSAKQCRSHLQARQKSRARGVVKAVRWSEETLQRRQIGAFRRPSTTTTAPLNTHRSSAPLPAAPATSSPAPITLLAAATVDKPALASAHPLAQATTQQPPLVEPVGAKRKQLPSNHGAAGLEEEAKPGVKDVKPESGSKHDLAEQSPLPGTPSRKRRDSWKQAANLSIRTDGLARKESAPPTAVTPHVPPQRNLANADIKPSPTNDPLLDVGVLAMIELHKSAPPPVTGNPTAGAGAGAAPAVATVQTSFVVPTSASPVGTADASYFVFRNTGVPRNPFLDRPPSPKRQKQAVAGGMHQPPIVDPPEPVLPSISSLGFFPMPHSNVYPPPPPPGHPPLPPAAAMLPTFPPPPPPPTTGFFSKPSIDLSSQGNFTDGGYSSAPGTAVASTRSSFGGYNAAYSQPMPGLGLPLNPVAFGRDSFATSSMAGGGSVLGSYYPPPMSSPATTVYPSLPPPPTSPPTPAQKN